jgi:hypothetical protein
MTTTTDTTTTSTTTDEAEEVRPGSRADRARQPRARDVLRETAVEFGVCVRPLAMRRVDLDTGETEVVDLPCGSTRAAVCPSCAARARKLRAQQCREGWHLTEDPDLTPKPATDNQRDLVKERAHVTNAAADAEDAGDDLTAEACRESAQAVDEELAATGVRGRLDPDSKPRRVRSTRRRQDTPNLPRRVPVKTTLGRTFTDERTGETFRPSLFVTLTLPSYGPVRRDDSMPVDPTRYDYVRAARDALHFGKLLDRWTQNLRRVAGYDVQYFAVVEPQKRAAPHAHFAIRGTLPRAAVKQLTAATYAQVWWPDVTVPAYTDTAPPVWDPTLAEGAGGFADPATGVSLQTWDEALDALDHIDPDALTDDASPRHVIRFGEQLDVKGVLAGSHEAERCIGYLVKYLVKDLGDDLDPLPHIDAAPEDDDRGPRLADRKATAARRADHVARLVEALRWERCSPSCPNWLRYGIQPKNPRPTMRPGCCRAKAHKPTHLGYGGRRVLVSRKWTAKDLADHRHDRRAHVLAILGHDTDREPQTLASASGDQPEGAVLWELAKQTDPDVPPLSRRVLRLIAHSSRWRAEYRSARDGLDPPDSDEAARPVDPAA